MAGWFEMSGSSDGQYRFVLKAGNGETILASELYKARDSATRGIASVQANCATDDRYDRKESSNGKFYFTLRAANHQVIGTSQMYTTASGRNGGIESVKTNGSTEDIRDHS